MSLIKDLIHLIRQFCYEEKLHKTAHMLEQETGFFFDMNYFEELLMSGGWDEAENYLSGFVSVEANQDSMKAFFELRKQKYYEALEKHDIGLALHVLLKDLKAFASSNEELYREMTSLLTLDDIREHPSLSSSYADVISARRQMIDAIKLIIKDNPDLQNKVEFPQIEKSRLRRLINQSLNWQHIQCAYPQSEPQMKTLLHDHKCSSESNDEKPSTFKAMPKAVPASEGAKVFSNASEISSTTTLDKMITSQKVPIQSHNLKLIILDDFPKTVERCMDMSSSPTSMDFHPSKHTLLLVGNIMGDIEVWDITSEARLFSNAFMIWKREGISTLHLNDLDVNQHISVTRVLWSPDGSFFGVAFSKHIVQLYSYHVNVNCTNKQLEIDAHSGGVNDLAFSSLNDQLLVITCGDDKFIQVWDSMSGSKKHTLEGHGASVYSLCPHVKEDIHLLLSTSTNGEIKAWLIKHTGPIFEYDAPGSRMRMAYSGDGKRLFSCGTNEDGDSYILEWNLSEGFITRTYHGLSRLTVGAVKFSTTRNRFLVAGDEHAIKVWDMDNVKVLTALDADGGLPATPYVCFNKEGTLLAAFAHDRKIKILANDVGLKLLQSSNSPCNSTGWLSDSLQKLSIRPDPVSAKVRIDDEMIPMEENMNRLLNTKNCSTIFQVNHCQFLRLPCGVKANKMCRLAYTNAGNGIVALAADGIHLLWKWSGYERCNNSAKATINHTPRLWQPRKGLLMINDLGDDKSKQVSSCFALSKNDTYLVSASGKAVSLFNTLTFKLLKSCLKPPPVATCMVFYPPDNNIIAIGMEDSTILIYNMRRGEENNRLIGHSKRITGLAFSNALKVLVSSGVDTQIIVWDSTTWEKLKSVAIQIPTGWLPSETSETNIQFQQDHKHFLAIHETQLAIYEASNLKLVNQWMIGDFCARIANATFSSDNQLVYAVMRDGIVVILTALDLCPRLEIDPSVYLPSTFSCALHPLVVAAHPQKPNQLALGLSDGGVIVLEPHKSQGTWIVSPPDNPEFAFATTIVAD